MATCPRLRPTVDLARVEANGARLVCLFDRQDPPSGQVVVSEGGLLLASLLDGERSVQAVRAAFALRTGAVVTEQQIVEFVRQLDEANLLDSERYREHVRQSIEAFRSSPVRLAAHAGRAYPADPDELCAFLDSRYTAEGGPGAPPSPLGGPSPRALIAPHIDLHRGGHSYAWGYRELAERQPAELYVLLGTCHLPMATPFAATAKPYETPLGPIPTDPAFLERLARRAPHPLYVDEYCHRAEHSLEFQALYLRYLGHAGDSTSARVIPILCVPPAELPGGATPSASPAVHEMLAALRETIAEDGRRICLIAGADFAHVGPQFGDPRLVDAAFAEQVRLADLAMLEVAARGDADGFYRQVVDEPPGLGMAGEAGAVGGPRRVCGLAPMYALLWLLGSAQGRVLHYDQWIDPAGLGSVTFGCVLFP